MHALDLDSLFMDVALTAVAVIAGLGVMIFLIVRREYVIWRLQNALLWSLILATTTCLALALNNLLWDRLYNGRYYEVAASFITVLFPVVWLPAIGFFRKDREPRSVWRAAAGAAILLSLLILIWVAGETMF